jgi:DNA polymerase III epsilon subunit-like protein
MLAQLQLMCGKKPDYSYLWRLFDTRCLGRAWKDKVKKPDSRDEYIYWQYKLIHDKTNIRERVSLKTLAKELGCDYDPNKHHDALYDVELTFEVFKKLAKILEL